MHAWKQHHKADSVIDEHGFGYEGQGVQPSTEVVAVSFHGPVVFWSTPSFDWQGVGCGSSSLERVGVEPAAAG